MKDEIKQLLIFTSILAIVIIIAIIVNSNKNTNRINTKIVNNAKTQMQQENIIDNLKGLLEETNSTELSEEEKQIKEMIETTSNNDIPRTVED